MEILEISVSLVIVALIGKYITYILEICNIFLPNVIYKFIIFALAISVVQYIISRKDD